MADDDDDLTLEPESGDGEVFDEDSTGGGEFDAQGGGEGAGGEEIDFEEQARRKSAMVDSLKKDIHDERKRRQAAEKRLGEIEERERKAQNEAIDGSIKEAKRKLAQAFDEDDGSAVADAQAELAELMARKTARGPVNGAGADVEERGRGGGADDGGDSGRPRDDGAAAPDIAPAAREWIGENPWFEQDDKLRNKAVQIANELEREEGFDPTDPDLYRELDRRIKPYRQRYQRGTPNAGPVSRGGDGPRKKGRRLSESDKQTMRLFGRDPSNAKHREAWLRRNEPLD